MTEQAINIPIPDLVNASKLEDKIGLCLSGGGYRAMIYHAGALSRLNEIGILNSVSEIASVSGGSIASSVLAIAWEKLQFDAATGFAPNFEDMVLAPLVRFGRVNLDVSAVIKGWLPWMTAGGVVAKAYDRHLLHGATLQKTPSTPRFTFMTTNLESGVNWRFARDYAADYRVGQILAPALPLSKVVAASSAFPPILSPVEIDLSGMQVQEVAGNDLHREPYTKRAVLTDGGVYDNLGLERVWKRCKTLLVSNAGSPLRTEDRPSIFWPKQAYRTLQIIHSKAEDSRERLLMALAKAGQRQVAYWKIGLAPAVFRLPDAMPLSDTDVELAAGVATRLTAMPDETILLLLLAGYVGADAAVRRYVRPGPAPALDGRGLYSRWKRYL